MRIYFGEANASSPDDFYETRDIDIDEDSERPVIHVTPMSPEEFKAAIERAERLLAGMVKESDSPLFVRQAQ